MHLNLRKVGWEKYELSEVECWSQYALPSSSLIQCK